MLAAAEKVDAVECAHGLEAEVRELRLIAAHAPPYNRRSKFPERVVWLKLTDEAFPRLSVVRALAEGDTAYLGPFASRRSAEWPPGRHAPYRLRRIDAAASTRSTVSRLRASPSWQVPAPCEHRISPRIRHRADHPFRDATTGDPHVIRR